ncbi:MAG: glycosyltransferase, partial [Candidatus Peribacteraceae bacterium]|nr:glycosyltransferase [Candidatus Peribacteraceae bacterium]
MSKDSKLNIVAVLPAHNEAACIADVIRDAKKYVDQVIVVTDGSKDDTSDVSKKAGAKVVNHMDNCGAGAATMTGIEAAR